MLSNISKCFCRSTVRRGCAAGITDLHSNTEPLSSPKSGTSECRSKHNALFTEVDAISTYNVMKETRNEKKMDLQYTPAPVGK